ncbi:glycosyltransferase [Vallicoccus soli]|uniref:Glycosyltransferase family 1 protein n=1 Tax=Vallicoccus soli TaxID=2339232 RepID=A0A3A3YSX8_9ACTN|nr:glycosyltransferase [Vallicoccus soli]RJK93800.1 glycosyltransferase family 1 protein [Vallicoccus soli]
MRIAMVSEHASPLAAIGGVDAGGQNVHVAALSAALARQGHEVVVHTRRDDPSLPQRVEVEPGFVVDHVDAGPPVPLPKDELLAWMPDFGHELARRWGAERPDIAHAHFWMSGLASLIARRATGVPVVQTFHALGVVKRRHQGAADTSPPERVRLEKAIARDVDRIVATCTDELSELVRLGADRRDVAIIPCGVDIDQFTESGPVAERGERTRILTVGRLVQRKGVDTAIAALAAVPDAELVVAGGPDAAHLGEDPEARRLRALAERRGVSDRVLMVGQVGREEMPALLRSADVVVCVPWYEPFGIVPLEAMACRRPVVASAVGGMLDTIADDITGLLVPPRRPDRLGATLRRLLADPFRLEAYGQAGIDRARSRYSWERIATETARVYGEVLSPRTVSPVAEVEDGQDGDVVDLRGLEGERAAGVVR